MPGYLKRTKEQFFAAVDTVPPGLEAARYPPLDGLRGIAILMVILPHTGFNHYLMPWHLYLESRTGVHLFFVISGFLITTLLLREKIRSGQINLRNFYIRRALRIIPVAYLFLLLLILLNRYEQLHISPLDFIASFLFLKNLPVGGPSSLFTAHFWSLAIEMQFYATFPLLLSLSINKYLVTALTVIILVPLASLAGVYLVPAVHLPPLLLLTGKVLMFSFWKGPVMILVGSVFSLLVFKKIIRPEALQRNYLAAFVVFVLGIAIQSRDFVFYSKYLSEYAGALLLAYSVVLSTGGNHLLATVLRNKLLVRTGTLSYSLYIWQQLFVGMYAWESWLGPLRGCPLYLLIPVKLACIFGLGAVSWYFFESRFLNWKKDYQ